MNKIDHLIDDLAKQPQPRALMPWRVACIRDCGLVLLYIVALEASFFGFRPDLLTQLQAPLFLLEILALTAVLVSTIVATHLAGYPDLQQRGYWLLIPLGALASFIVIMGLALFADQPPSPSPENELNCLVEISLLALLPALLLMLKLRRMASTRQGLAGALALLAAFSCGALILRLAEETNAIAHIIVWHYLPGFGVALLGVLAGRLILKW